MSSRSTKLKVETFEGDVPTVKLTGETDFHNRTRIMEAFEGLLAAGHSVVRADLGELLYMDSSSLSALIRCATKAIEAGGAIELVAASPHASRVMNLCGAMVFFETKMRQSPAAPSKTPVPVMSGPWRVIEFDLPGAPGSAAVARAHIAELVRSLPFDSVEAQDITIAVGEALANAIKHGCKCDPSKQFSVKCMASQSRLEIEITDPGPGFDLDSVRKPVASALAEGGMGIYVMREMMDEVCYTFTECTKVRLVKYVKSARPVAADVPTDAEPAEERKCL